MHLPNRHSLPVVERRERRLPRRACLGLLSCAGPTGCHGLGHLPMLAEPSSVCGTLRLQEPVAMSELGTGVGGLWVGGVRWRWQ